MPIIASDFLFHSTVMRGSLRGISTDDLVRDSIHSAPQLVQLAELALDFQLLLDALARSGVQLLFQCRILGGQFLVGLVVLFEFHPHDLYAGDMEVRFELDSDDFLLPALSVQPLVENAIKHGLMGLESGGTVTVSSYETDMDYRISVVDDGVGFDTSILLDDREHIGIRNIRGRIAAMCGGTLTVESVPGKGTKAVITIPKERGEHP